MGGGLTNVATVQFCRELLKSYGADESEILELLAYNCNVFQLPAPGKLDDLSPEPCVATWTEYARAAESFGAVNVLSSHLVQLQFPIQAGISNTVEYRSATRQGKLPVAANPLQLVQPEGVQIQIHPTLAGDIPVITIDARTDFVALVRAITKRNEPHPIPDSMGACIVVGYNNWHRVRQYQQQWLDANQDRDPPLDKSIAFQEMLRQPELYQDRFILVGRGAYSNVTADRVGLSAAEWWDRSHVIRLEHECTHYITRRWFGSMRNNILDELIADYRGIVAAWGSYRADWFLTFIGLEGFPDYRLGGRLENYLGEPPLSAGAFVVLQRLVKAAADNLERFDRHCRQSDPPPAAADILIGLSTLRLEELAADDSSESISAAINSVRLTRSSVRGCLISPQNAP
jgi:hypothetical protein